MGYCVIRNNNKYIEELNNKIKTLSTNVLYKPDSKNLN